jgi:hypothetical protein
MPFYSQLCDLDSGNAADLAWNGYADCGNTAAVVRQANLIDGGKLGVAAPSRGCLSISAPR